MISGAELERLWSAARAKPSSSAFRTAATGVEVADGTVLAAVDGAGLRALLVPISTKHTLTENLEGKAVVLRRRALEDESTYRTYACLELVCEDQRDLFTALAVEVLDRVSAAPQRAVAAVRSVLSDWRALLAGASSPLGPSELAGLFGELCVLRELVQTDPGAVAFWTGPEGSAQDFHRGMDAIEVKATTGVEGRKVRIHGLDQLELPPPGRLILRWFRLRTDGGQSVPALVDELLDMVDDAPTFRRLLARCGYRDTDRETYAPRLFEAVEERAFEIAPGFPRITAAGLTGDAKAAGLGPVDYVLDLDSAPAEAARIGPWQLATFMGGA